MLRTIYESASPRFIWLDLVDPARGDLERVTREHGLPLTAVTDCLDPEHLPKFERFEGTGFAILRAFDEHSAPQADTIQSLTRKVALFWGDGFLISIHRKAQSYLTVIQERWAGRTETPPDAAGFTAELLVDIANAVVLSYEPPLADAESRVDEFEGSLLRNRDVPTALASIYRVKRRILLAKRLLWRTLHVAIRLPVPGVAHAPLIQDLRENAESMHFYADELLEDVNNLLNMQLALAAHRTNQVVQVLTVFSAFFLPLTFIVGVYGMNFEHMPELTQRLGYPAVWLFMIGVSAAIWIWFRRRGWLT